MIAVFCGFLLGDERVIKLFGIGLASAIFLDAFVVRTELVPALMHLFGRANWYYPSWLDRITPRLSIEPRSPSRRWIHPGTGRSSGSWRGLNAQPYLLPPACGERARVGGMDRAHPLTNGSSALPRHPGRRLGLPGTRTPPPSLTRPAHFCNHHRATAPAEADHSSSGCRPPRRRLEDRSNVLDDQPNELDHVDEF